MLTATGQGEYPFALMAGDVVAFCEVLGLARVRLVGHSMGGAVALGVALRCPDLVARLVAEDVTPPYPRDRPVPQRPAGPLDFDREVVQAIVAEVNAGDQAAWTALPGSTWRRCSSPAARRVTSPRTRSPMQAA